jgi:DNA-binding MarR family transcriptional regulator
MATVPKPMEETERTGAFNQTAQECIETLINVFPRLTRIFKSQMRGGPLTPPQMFLLMGIQDLSELHQDGAQPGELARRACLSSAAITAALDDLVEGGYCVRAHSEKDRRKVLVHLTPLGTEVLNEARAGTAAAVRGMLDGLSEAQMAQLRDSLRDLGEAAEEYVSQQLTCSSKIPHDGSA